MKMWANQFSFEEKPYLKCSTLRLFTWDGMALNLLHVPTSKVMGAYNSANVQYE